MAPRKLLYLTETDVQRCITMPEAVALAKKGIVADAAGGEFGFRRSAAGIVLTAIRILALETITETKV